MCYNVFIAFGLCVVKHKDGRFFKLISPKNGPGSCYFSVKVYKFRHNFLNNQEKSHFFVTLRRAAGRDTSATRRGGDVAVARGGAPPATVAWPWMPPPVPRPAGSIGTGGYSEARPRARVHPSHPSRPGASGERRVVDALPWAATKPPRLVRASTPRRSIAICDTSSQPGVPQLLFHLVAHVVAGCQPCAGWSRCASFSAP